MVVCAGGGKRGYVKYGCHQHKHNGQCSNKLMIRQDRLEEQLLHAIHQRILSPKILDAAIDRCEEEIRKRLAEMVRQGSISSVESLTKDLEDKKRRQSKLIDAIETAGDITSLVERLREIEGEIKRIQNAITSYRPLKLDQAMNGLRERVTKELLGLKDSLLAASTDADMVRAKSALTKHVGKLILTPSLRDGRPVYKVTGNVTVGDDSEKCRKQLVARDGIGTPTVSDSR
jgi:hypothetical protein